MGLSIICNQFVIPFVLEVRTQELDFRQKEEGASRTRIRELK
jgi:hypothetical protein